MIIISKTDGHFNCFLKFLNSVLYLHDLVFFQLSRYFTLINFFMLNRWDSPIISLEKFDQSINTFHTTIEEDIQKTSTFFISNLTFKFFSLFRGVFSFRKSLRNFWSSQRFSSLREPKLLPAPAYPVKHQSHQNNDLESLYLSGLIINTNAFFCKTSVAASNWANSPNIFSQSSTPR